MTMHLAWKGRPELAGPEVCETSRPGDEIGQFRRVSLFSESSVEAVTHP
jgi:hypothetical protein